MDTSYAEEDACILEALQAGRSSVIQGFPREACVDAICAYILRRYRRPTRPCRDTKEPKPSGEITPEKEKKRRKLTPFVNETETTALTRCTSMVVVPNIGLLREIVKGLMGLPRETLLGNPGMLFGEEEDAFLITLQYNEETKTFTEEISFRSDIVLTTSRQLVELGDKSIDRSKYLIEKKEELEDFDRKAKIEMGVYSFISGVDTVVFLDTHLLARQNARALEECVSIVMQARPVNPRRLNLNYISSGEEKKYFYFLGSSVTHEVLSMLEAQNISPRVINKSIEKKTLVSKGKGEKVPEVGIALLDATGKDSAVLAEHHINLLARSSARVLVVLRDVLDIQRLRDKLQGTSLLGVSGIFFLDEHIPRRKVKEEISGGAKKIWAVTERFFFYRRGHLQRLLAPFRAEKALFLNVPDAQTLSDVLKHSDIVRTEQEKEEADGICSVPILVLARKRERYSIELLLQKAFEPEEAFRHVDWILDKVPAY